MEIKKYGERRSSCSTLEVTHTHTHTRNNQKKAEGSKMQVRDDKTPRRRHGAGLFHRSHNGKGSMAVGGEKQKRKSLSTRSVKQKKIEG